MKSGSFNASGFKDLDRKLRQLQSALPEAVVRDALRAGAQVIADEARRLVPTDTYRLHDSIKVTEDRDMQLYARQGGAVSVFVGPTGSTEDGDTYYAKFVEFGTRRHNGQPFMRPAIAAKRDEAGLVTTRYLAGEIAKAAK